MNWRIRVWCRDCYGEDRQGCFDGGTETLDGEYATREAAEEMAESIRLDNMKPGQGAPYEWEVFEEPRANSSMMETESEHGKENTK